MRTPRSLSSLLLVLGALTMLAMPASAIAGSQKKAAAASKSSKVDKARSNAAKKGWETRRMNQKAEANWASRIGKDPKADKPGAREAFLKRSVAAQRGWQKRNTASPAAAGKKGAAKQAGKKSAAKQAGKKSGKQAGKQAVATKGKQGGNKKKAAKQQSGKKKAAKQQSGKKKGKTASVTPGSEPNMIANAGVGNADFTKALARFDAARDARSRGRQLDGAVAQMEGHDAMAKAAFATADEYEKAGRIDEANQLIEFGNEHVTQADKIEAAIAQMAPKQGRVRRFFARLAHPFKKRGGGEGQVAVAGQQ